MSESQVFEVYECQSYNRTNKWHPHADIPWASKNPPAPCVQLLEITLPNNEWVWVSEWIVEKRAGFTDEDGWEYASRISRFLDENRPPKPEAHKWSTVRRRLWTRVMRREIGIRASDIPKAMQKIQAGLASIHSARIRIEEIIKQAPQATQNEQMISLVQSVKKNINEVLSSLDQISTFQHKHCSPQTTATAAVKKLRNDVMKEDVAIERAINPGKGSPNINANREFLRLQKSQSNSFAESRSNAVVGGINNRTSSSPPRVGNNKMIQKGGSFASSPYLKSTNLPTMKELDEANISLSSKVSTNTGVKSGRADTFDPSVFQSANHVAGVDSDKGLFVDRNKRELQIAEKFIAVDEATVMQEIIEERDVEIKKMHTGIVQVNEMFVDLARLVKEQEVEIDQIFQNADESHEKTKNALAHIVEADRLQKTGNCVIC